MEMELLVRILRARPEHRMAITRLAWECLGDDGELDPAKVLARADQIRVAYEEVRACRGGHQPDEGFPGEVAVSQGQPPLEVLWLRLNAWLPPRLDLAVDAFTNSESYHEFLELVDAYLPEESANIRDARSQTDRVATFVTRFTERYFPAWGHNPWEMGLEYSDINRSIICPAYGIDYEEPHEPESFRDGLLLMGCLTIQSYTDYATDLSGENDLVTIWMETAAGLVDQADLELVLNHGGWSHIELHHLLDGTPYEGAAVNASWIQSETGNVFYDFNEETPPYRASWSMENVIWLTQQYLELQEMQRKERETWEWLEEDPRGHFHQLVAFLLRQEEVRNGQLEFDDLIRGESDNER
jgi:hypothetical protein